MLAMMESKGSRADDRFQRIGFIRELNEGEHCYAYCVEIDFYLYLLIVILGAKHPYSNPRVFFLVNQGRGLV
jgi:hypothetical protein